LFICAGLSYQNASRDKIRSLDYFAMRKRRMQWRNCRDGNLFREATWSRSNAFYRFCLGPLCLAALLVSFLAFNEGCGSKSVTTVGRNRPFGGVLVGVASPGDPVTAILSRYGSAWASETGGRLEIVGYDASTASEAGLASDVWIIPPVRMPYWANAGKLRPI